LQRIADPFRSVRPHPRSTWLYVSIVIAMLEWPSRSCATFG